MLESDSLARRIGQRWRAQLVADWLVRHGIKKSLIEVKGYGKSRPKVPNTSDENRARNRRVEIVVIDSAGI